MLPNNKQKTRNVLAISRRFKIQNPRSFSFFLSVVVVVHYHLLYYISPTQRRNNTASIQAIIIFKIIQCASPAVYASPHQKSLSSKGSVNLTASCRPASMSFGARANSMLGAFLLVSINNQGRQRERCQLHCYCCWSWSNFCVKNCPRDESTF